MAKIRTYGTQRGAEKRRDELRKKFPDKFFRLGTEPGGFRWCVVEYNPQHPQKVAYCQ